MNWHFITLKMTNIPVKTILKTISNSLKTIYASYSANKINHTLKKEINEFHKNFQIKVFCFIFISLDEKPLKCFSTSFIFIPYCCFQWTVLQGKVIKTRNLIRRKKRRNSGYFLMLFISPFRSRLTELFELM